ncbi:MAG: acetyl-CoA carboxylase biotin carboxyl carrier protein [Fischerella sp. CENA71]|nr:acetyl-CoA carboxylase biotin carboxyl carrier protein [Fischerella sp. CENA71]
MSLNFHELQQLLLTIAQSNLAELILKTHDFELTVRKSTSVKEQLLLENQLELGKSVVAKFDSTSLTAISTAALSTEVNPANSIVVDSAKVSTQEQLAMTVSLPLESNLVEIVSPMVGTFYRTPAPSEPPFVEVGDRVKVGQTVCIIEAMKLMNEIEAEISGQIVEILVQSGQAVEFGQHLMRIKPD